MNRVGGFMKSKFILIIALVMAIITTVLFRQYLVNINNKARAASQTITVVVAKVDIKSNQKVTSEMLETKDVSAGSILSDAIKKNSDVVGKYAVADLKAGEVLYPIRFTDLLTENKDLTLKIAEGARAVSIGVTDVTAVAKMIQPEDKVDIVNTLNGQTSLLLENVRVLAVGKSLSDANATADTADYGTITLQLYPGDVEKVVNANEVGAIKFVLRGKHTP
jgi:pilus assembly protein CpaB